jgi:hypothetical protein
MPIPREELEKAQKPMKERVLEFLCANATNAYHAVEIFAAVEGYPDAQAVTVMLSLVDEQGRKALIAPFGRALAELEGEHAIICAKRGGVDYYAAGVTRR